MPVTTTKPLIVYERVGDSLQRDKEKLNVESTLSIEYSLKVFPAYDEMPSGV